MKRNILMLVLVTFFISVTVEGRPKLNAPQVITISAAGDCTLGQDERYTYGSSFIQTYDENTPAYFFENVAAIFQADDLTLINLEGTLTHATVAAEKTYIYKGPPYYAEILKLGGIEAVNLANNHTNDYFQKGYADTKAALTEYGIGYFGNGVPYITEIKGITVGLLGYKGSNRSSRDVMQRDIHALRENGAQLVIVSFHWGDDRSHYPNALQKELGHYAIDSGADLVLGHHPHVIQGLELYKDKYIVYSLANFCYGGHKNPADKDTFIFQQSFIFVDGLLTENNPVRIIPASVSSVTHRNDYKPTPHSGDEALRVMARLALYSEPLNDKPLHTVLPPPETVLPQSTDYNTLPLLLDGQPLIFDHEPYLADGRIMARVNAVTAVLGMQLDWQESTQTLRIVSPQTADGDADSVVMEMRIGRPEVWLNGRLVYFTEAVPVIRHEVIFVPIEQIMEWMGMTVVWDPLAFTMHFYR